jgi:Ras-related protein Rab-11A
METNIISEAYDIIFKVVLIGDSGVGKTNILSRYIKDDFSIETKNTVGVEFGSKIIKFKENTIKIQIWDTAGQERYRSITNAYYKGAKGAMVVYDISKRYTFDNIDKWISELKNSGDEDVNILLVGNKCDLEDQREITKEEAEKKAENFKCAFIETSAMQAVNIEKAFNMLVENVSKKFVNKENNTVKNLDDIKGTAIVLNNNENKNENEEDKTNGKKKKCCKN